MCTRRSLVAACGADVTSAESCKSPVRAALDVDALPKCRISEQREQLARLSISYHQSRGELRATLYQLQTVQQRVYKAEILVICIEEHLGAARWRHITSRRVKSTRALPGLASSQAPCAIVHFNKPTAAAAEP